MRRFEDLRLWLVEKQVARLIVISRVLDRQGNKGCVCLVSEQSQVETCRDLMPVSQGEGSKKFWISAEE